MAKVIFSISYDIIPDKRTDYMDVIRELKNLVKAEGLINYSVYEKKNRKNSFEEIYTFTSLEAYENFEDSQNERIDILMDKLSDMIKQQSTNYSTLVELES